MPSEAPRATTKVLAEAIADQLGVDMTPEFVTQIDLARYRLFLAGYVIRPLKDGPSQPPAAFAFPRTGHGSR